MSNKSIKDQVMNSKKTPTFTHTALSVWYNPDTKDWGVVTVQIDPVTMQSGKMDFVPAGPYRDFAIEKFKLMAAELNMVG